MTRLALTIIEAADAAGISQDTIRDEVNKGKLPAKRMGRRILIKVDDLKQWIDDLEDVAS